MITARIGALAAVLALGAPVMAEDMAPPSGGVRQGTVVELYTSQGCSSCPPADDLLRELAGRPGVIALSLHVDYWDYIGWTDSFGQERFTDRQKAYARAEGSRTIYTPQMIVDGSQRVAGVDAAAVEAALAAASQPVSLRLERAGARMAISADPLAASMAPGAIRVQLVRYLPRAQVMIEAGENAGRMVDYVNIVTSWAVIGHWDGASPLQMQAEVPGTDGVAVVLQAEDENKLPGAILGAALTE